MPYIESGQLNRRAAIHTIVETADSFGQAVRALSDPPVATVWCRVRTLAGKESVHGEQVTGLVTHEVQTRYSASLLPVGPKMVLVIDGRQFNVESVTDTDDAHVELIWRCTEIKN